MGSARRYASLWLMACQLLALSSGATVTLAASRSRGSNRGAIGRNGRCRMSTPPAASAATYTGELGPNGETELAVRVASAGVKGMGAFAAEAAQPGRWIGSYQGRLISLDEQRDLYSETDPEYLFKITPDLYIDGNLSTHFTRFFNHDQKGNLNFTVSARSGMFGVCLAEPQCARRGSLGVLYRLLAALRTRNEPLGCSGPNGRGSRPRWEAAARPLDGWKRARRVLRGRGCAGRGAARRLLRGGGDRAGHRAVLRLWRGLLAGQRGVAC